MPRPPTRHAAVVVCVPGFEHLVADELDALGVRARPAGRGALAGPMTTRQLYACNLHLATATRVLVTAASFAASSFPELERRCRALPWDDWLPASGTVRLRVTSHRSRLVHTGAVAERVAAAAGRVPSSDGPLVVVRLDADRVSIRLDTSGDPLHRRGWRPELAKAPLRETAAAALLLAAGWAGDALVDPCCGSGTIPIEAACRARGLAPGRLRSFAFQTASGFEPGTWASVQGAARAAERPAGAGPPIVARDRDAGAVAATRANAERAGVADDLVVEHAAVSSLVAPASAGLVVSNLPFGRRVGGGDLRNLYARLGTVLQDRFAGWRGAFLVADRVLTGQLGLHVEPVLAFDLGGIPAQLVVSGPFRRVTPTG